MIDSTDTANPPQHASMSQFKVVDNCLQIGGQPPRGQSVYVFATENFQGLPTVHYIDILGAASVEKDWFPVAGRPAPARVRRPGAGLHPHRPGRPGKLLRLPPRQRCL